MIKHIVRMCIFAVIFIAGNFLDDLVADHAPSATQRYIEAAIATVVFGLLMAIADRFLEMKA